MFLSIASEQGYRDAFSFCNLYHVDVELVTDGGMLGQARKGCPSRHQRLHAGAKAIEMFDTNKDGKLSGAELEQCPSLKAAVARMDTTGQGAITAEMIADRIRAWQKTMVGRMPFSCLVRRNGQPLVGAEVKFVPEKFLGSAIKEAKGTTDKLGAAVITIVSTDPSMRPGVALGFYRVEITKAGENIPAKYNTATVLGQEIAPGDREVHDGAVRLTLLTGRVRAADVPDRNKTVGWARPTISNFTNGPAVRRTAARDWRLGGRQQSSAVPQNLRLGVANVLADHERRGLFDHAFAWRPGLSRRNSCTCCGRRPPPNSALVFLFGVLWGVGGLTFGLSVRYLGMSLGFAMVLGLCAACGTLVPPIVHGTFGPVHHTLAGQIVSGRRVDLPGRHFVVRLCGGPQGTRTERRAETGGREGVLLAEGLCRGGRLRPDEFVHGLRHRRRQDDRTDRRRLRHSRQSTGTLPVLVLVMGGNAAANVVWCLLLGATAGSLHDYAAGPARRLAGNYFFAVLAGVIGYNEFFWYGMGTTKMGRYDFSSWSIHLAFVIIFSSLWGMLFREWHGVGRRTRRLLWGGLATLILSTAVIGAGNCISTYYPPEYAAKSSTNPNHNLNTRN